MLIRCFPDRFVIRVLCGALTSAFALTLTTPVAEAASRQDYAPDPGLGVSEAMPEGPPFELPEGLTLEDPIRGYNGSDPEDCDYKYAEQGVGKGEQVRICLMLNNQTDAPITLQLPPGLIFVSRKLQHQNGMIAQRISIEVPAKTRYFQPLFAYCVNSSRDSSSLESEYELGPVATQPRFQAFFRFLEDKVIDDINFVAVNLALGDLAEGGEISDFVRTEYLNGL